MTTPAETHSPSQIPTTVRPFWKRLLVALTGIVLIIAGTIGWLTPVIPGFPLILLGIPMLLSVHPRTARHAHRLNEWLKSLPARFRSRKVAPPPTPPESLP